MLMLINQVVQAIPCISIVLRTLITACNQCTFTGNIIYTRFPHTGAERAASTA